MLVAVRRRGPSAASATLIAGDSELEVLRSSPYPVAALLTGPPASSTNFTSGWVAGGRREAPPLELCGIENGGSETGVRVREGFIEL